MYYESTLSHHGILGQKWGIRRFQTKTGALTPAGKKRYSDDGDDSSSDESRGHGGNARRYANADGSLTQEGIARLRAKRRGEIDDDFDADFEEVKKTVLSSGKASDVYELRGQISNKELQDAVARINWEKQLKNVAVEDQKTVFDTIETIGKRAQTVSNAINSVDNLMTSAGKVLDRVDKITGSDRFKKIKDGIDVAGEAKKAAKKVAEDIAKEADAKPKEKEGLFTKKDKEEKAEAKLEKEAEKAKAEEPKPADSERKTDEKRWGPETEKAIAETKARKSSGSEITSKPGTVTVTRELGGGPKPTKEVTGRNRWPHAEFRKTESKAKTKSSSDDDDDMWTAYESWTPAGGTTKKRQPDWLAGQRWSVRRKKKK